MMQITRAALQDQVNPFTQATTLMSHTPVNCYTILGEDSSSPTNPMIDPFTLGQLNDEIGNAKGRGVSDDGEGTAEKRMGTVSDGHMTRYLIHH
jgi:hypothetical protein